VRIALLIFGSRVLVRTSLETLDHVPPVDLVRSQAGEVVSAARFDVAETLVPPMRPVVEVGGEERQFAARLSASPQGVADQRVAVAATTELFVRLQGLKLGDAVYVIDVQLGVGPC